MAAKKKIPNATEKQLRLAIRHGTIPALLKSRTVSFTLAKDVLDDIQFHNPKFIVAPELQEHMEHLESAGKIGKGAPRIILGETRTDKRVGKGKNRMVQVSMSAYPGVEYVDVIYEADGPKLRINSPANVAADVMEADPDDMVEDDDPANDTRDERLRAREVNDLARNAARRRDLSAPPRRAVKEDVAQTRKTPPRVDRTSKDT